MEMEIIGYVNVLIGLLIITGAASVFGMSQMVQFVNRIFNHPFLVQRAVLSVEGEVLTIEALLCSSYQVDDLKELRSRQDQIVSKLEVIEEHFVLIAERYLGPAIMQEEPRERIKELRYKAKEILRVRSKVEMDEFKALVEKNQVEIQEIMAQMNALKDFASNKALEFQRTSLKRSRIMNIIMFILFIVTCIIGYFSHTQILNHLKEFH